MTNAKHIVIVGSGVAGATISAKLLEGNVGRVTMLEAGPHVPMRDYRKWLDYVTSRRLPYKRCEDVLSEVENTGKVKWNLVGGRLFARGGSTLHWGGWSFRLKPEDFQLHSATGQNLDWPFSYSDLEPYYGQAERLLHIAGDSNDQSSPRSSEYPFQPIPFTLSDGVVSAALDRLGIDYGHMPIARNVRSIDDMPACQTTGTCKYCPLGARFSADQVLDGLEGNVNFELRLNVAVNKVLMSGKHTARGVETINTVTKDKQFIEADAVILCAGALETPKILLNSHDQFWPQGIGNETDNVGRHLIAHPLLIASGFTPSNPERLYPELDFPTLCSRHYDEPKHQATGKMMFCSPPISPHKGIDKYMMEGRSFEAVEDAVEGRAYFELHGLIEEFSHPENRVLLGNGVNKYGVPKTKIQIEKNGYRNVSVARHSTNLHKILDEMGVIPQETRIPQRRGDHAMATCRMSLSEEDGVVDSNLRVHGVDNLYICSNAVFPSGGAVNPTLTLTALALKLSESFTQ